MSWILYDIRARLLRLHEHIGYDFLFVFVTLIWGRSSVSFNEHTGITRVVHMILLCVKDCGLVTISSLHSLVSVLLVEIVCDSNTVLYQRLLTSLNGLKLM